MLKVGIIGANGKAGALIAKAAVNRGMAVTAIVRQETDQDQGYTTLVKDLFALTPVDVQALDVLVSAVNFPDDTTKFDAATQHLIELVRGTQIHLMIVGGAGSLWLDTAHTQQLKDAPDFPSAFKPTATAMAQSLATLKAAKDVNWTYVSPAADFSYMGGLTGKYVITDDVFATDDDGKSFLSYKDYAQAFVTIMAKKIYRQKHVGVHHV
ncbi:NAD(P)H-binding protein [Agrilactobacillus fermenti]|uniref:NAD(P)H-binding protein n=1 Tax=Agrilactobacillus fermenti TaxID=2586909 RepID=UPI003A5C30DF